MNKLLELSRQRIQAFDGLKENIQNIASNIQEAQKSHLESAEKESLIDLANKWNTLTAQDAKEKGRQAGYAEACNDFMPLMQNLFTVLDEQRNQLQELFEELLIEEAQDEVIVEAEPVPLVSKRRSKKQK